jgi:outer membrane receptor for ferrienterochelin and colicins
VTIYGFTREKSLFDANNDGFSETPMIDNITVGTRFCHRFGFRSKISLDLFNIREERNGGNRQDYPYHERDIGESVKHNIRTGAVKVEQFFRDYDQFSVYLSAQHLNRDSYYGSNRSL